MRIISYNVNGIRAAIKKDLTQWVIQEDPDIFCIQESKAQQNQVPEEIFGDLGYEAYWNSAVKKGYSGVVTFSKKRADNVELGMGIEKFDHEGRVIRTDFGDLTVLNCYFPSGSSGEIRHQYKMEFLQAMAPWVKDMLEERPQIIIVGDYNVVHLDIDIHNPKRKDNPSGFRPGERDWLKSFFSEDFKDALRVVKPDEIAFSWWTYRAGARAKNKGWRIDYQGVSNAISNKIVDAGHLFEAKHSDHCPVYLEIDL